MIRLSILRNYPVICHDRQIGLLQSINLDRAQKRVSALLVSCGFHGKRVILPQNVLAIADGFILADEISKYRRAYDEDACAFVRDTTGLLAGKVTDYAIDEKTLSILAVEMSLGYWPSERRTKLWIYEYARAQGSQDELTVPASIGRELTISREGNEQCACPP